MHCNDTAEQRVTLKSFDLITVSGSAVNVRSLRQRLRAYHLGVVCLLSFDNFVFVLMYLTRACY